MDNKNLLNQSAKDIGLHLTLEQEQKFLKYMELLKEYNKKVNLTAITEDTEIIIKHFIDSLTCIKTGVIQDGVKLMDVGTGAGFPGIPIKIFKKDIHLVLLDASLKKVKFLKKVIKELNLTNTTAFHERVELLGRDEKFREQMDVVVTRAVASIAVVSEYCLPLVKKGGYFICQKGRTFKQELNQGKKAVEITGGELDKIMELKLPLLNDTRNILVIKKVLKTPEKYPRRPGIPEKKPINSKN